MSERIRFAIRIIYINVVFSLWGSVHKMARTIIPTLPSMRRRTPGRAYISSIRQKTSFLILLRSANSNNWPYSLQCSFFCQIIDFGQRNLTRNSSPDAPRRHKGAMLVKFGCLPYKTPTKWPIGQKCRSEDDTTHNSRVQVNISVASHRNGPKSSYRVQVNLSVNLIEKTSHSWRCSTQKSDLIKNDAYMASFTTHIGYKSTYR